MTKFKLGVKPSYDGFGNLVLNTYDLMYGSIRRGNVSFLHGKWHVAVNLRVPKYIGYRVIASLELPDRDSLSARELAYWANQAVLDAQSRLDEFVRPLRLQYMEDRFKRVKLGLKLNETLCYFWTKDDLCPVPDSQLRSRLIEPGFVQVLASKINVLGCPIFGDGTNAWDLPF